MHQEGPAGETLNSGARLRQLQRGFQVIVLGVVLLSAAPAFSWIQENRSTGEDEALLPSGKGTDLTRSLCGSCHSVATFTALRRSRVRWEDTVSKMISLGTLISDDEFGIVVQYLAEVFGPDSPPLLDANRAGKEDLKKLPGLNETAVQRLLDYREQKGRLENSKQVKEVLGPEVFDKVKGYLEVRNCG